MYKARKVQKYAFNSQLQALQILTNDDEVENWRLSSFFLAVLQFPKRVSKSTCQKNAENEVAKEIVVKFTVYETLLKINLKLYM